MSGYNLAGNITESSSNSNTSLKRHHSVAHGSFGELIQGELPGENNPFLVTCPINLSARTTFYPIKLAGKVSVFPQNKTKVKRAITLYLNKENVFLSGILNINSDIPCGKGMASSSADIVSALNTIAKAIGRPLVPETIESIMREIEPSDGVMYEKPVIYNHRNASLIKQLDSLPEMFILAIDQGGEIDTISFNHRQKSYSHTDKQDYARLLVELEMSVQNQDIHQLGKVTTISATMNQSRSPKLHFDDIVSLAEEIQSPGIICAHSGTMLGLILSPTYAEFEQQLAYATNAVAKCSLDTELVSTL